MYFYNPQEADSAKWACRKNNRPFCLRSVDYFHIRMLSIRHMIWVNRGCPLPSPAESKGPSNSYYVILYNGICISPLGLLWNWYFKLQVFAEYTVNPMYYCKRKSQLVSEVTTLYCSYQL